ncbi:hypothetical protein D9Q98_009432 [Chlorella vulgaris]|uniref:Tyrosine-specific transport n=1 Tax=Chlorella vulgaris TaxID=3077 RepID=A0A9D4TF77_CHLVU|nr:hypothetical protein D9Q98_009432 [Chlorella vulgaris]
MRVKQGGLAAKRLTRGIGLNDSKTPQPRRSPCHAPRCRGRLVVEAVAAPAPREGDVGRRRSAEITTAPATSTAAPKQHVGSLFGAVALITGSTVGAGMLALPAVTAPAGIVPTATSLTVIWGLLTLDALLIAEVNLAARAARDASRAEAALDAVGAAAGGSPSSGGIVTLRQMAEFTLGKAGKGFTLVYLLLAYSLLTAYCTKAASVLDYFAGGGLPPLAASTAFVGLIGGMLYTGGSRTVDALCQALTSVLLLLFGVILTAGAAQSGLPGSLAGGHADWAALEPAVPIMFLALVYHDLIPVIVDYLGGDRKNIRSAIVLGSLVPLAMFLSWEVVALSLLPSGLAESAAASDGHVPLLQTSLQLATSGDAASGPAAAVAVAAAGGGSAVPAVPAVAAASTAAAIAVDPLEVFVRRSSPVLGSVVEAFAFLAVMTSFIGTTLSLSETLRTEVPPLLREACKQLRLLSGAEVPVELSDDDLACLASGGYCTPGVAGCSATAALHSEREAAAAAQSSDWRAFGGEQRGMALLLTLCPPLAMAAANPDSFLGALQLAGGYFMTLLFGILPPVMAWQLRTKLAAKHGGTAPGTAAQSTAGMPGSHASTSPALLGSGEVLLPAVNAPSSAAGTAAAGAQGQQQRQARGQPWWQLHEEMVPGGTLVLGGLFSAAMFIELSRLAADLGSLAGSGSDGSGGQPGHVQSLVEAFLLSPSTPEAAADAISQVTAALATFQV